MGERAKLEFELAEQPIHAPCEVLYRQGHGDDAGVGVRFLRLSPSAVERIRSCLAGDRAS